MTAPQPTPPPEARRNETGADDGCLYQTVVTHQRFHPRRHRLAYCLWYLFVDVDALPELDRRLRLFGYNRRRPIAIYDRDHGDRTGKGAARSIRAWLDRTFAESGYRTDGRSYRMLCLPRIFGFGFNPITVFYSRDASGNLDAILYEVHNTFGERHSYLVAAPGEESGRIRQQCSKAFYVSPFFKVRGSYRFRTLAPGREMALAIEYHDDDRLLLNASMRGSQRPLTDRRLLIELIKAPYGGVKVLATIHFEALKLWLKRVPMTLKDKPRVRSERAPKPRHP